MHFTTRYTLNAIIMLAKKYKLTKKDGIGAIVKYGHFQKGRFVHMFSRSNIRNRCFFSVVVSTSISKNAPVRNRLRRQLFEIIRLQEALTNSKNYDIVFVARKAITSASFQELTADTTDLLKKL